jgi:hypothetical protein
MKAINAIGIDIGYGFTKVCADNVSSMFPSHVSRVRARGAFGTPENIIIVNGQTFVVGDNISSFGDHSVSSEFVGGPEYLALLGHALTMAKYPHNILVMGLPPGLYDDARIAKLERIISMANIQGNSGPVRIPKVVKFIPQGAGIYFDYINSAQLRCQQPNSNTVIIDVGHFTLDIVMYSKQAYVTAAARSYPLGISKLLTEVKNQFTKTHGVFLNNDDNALKLIREGAYTHFGKTYKLDVAPLMDEYINQKVMKAVGNFAAESRQDSNLSVDEIVIGGGGVSRIGQFAGDAVIIEDPQMSNARGYYQFGCRQSADNAPLRVCANN